MKKNFELAENFLLIASYKEKAVLKCFNKEYYSAIYFYKKILFLKPTNNTKIEIIKELIGINFYLEKFNEVIFLTKDLMQLRKNSNYDFIVLGFSYIKIKKFKKAEYCLNRISIEEYPEFCAKYIGLCLLMDQLDKFEKSIHYFGKFVEVGELRGQNFKIINIDLGKGQYLPINLAKEFSSTLKYLINLSFDFSFY